MKRKKTMTRGHNQQITQIPTVLQCVGCSSRRMKVEMASVSSVAQSCAEFSQSLDRGPCLCPNLDPCLCHNLCLCPVPSPSLAPVHVLGFLTWCVASKLYLDLGCDLPEKSNYVKNYAKKCFKPNINFEITVPLPSLST